MLSQAQWYTPVVTTSWRLRWEDLKFEASLGNKIEPVSIHLEKYPLSSLKYTSANRFNGISSVTEMLFTK
jgi:hypothetical protein